MSELEKRLRAQMGDDDFESCYRSCFGRLRADRYGDYPLHEVVLRMVQSVCQMQNGEEPMFMPFGAPGVPTPQPDSVRIIQGSRTSSPPPRKGSSSGDGCYIATSVYGEYNCPQVWTLRRYRDYVLARTWYGRLFIHSYYIISPTLVKWFGKAKWFKCLWRTPLDMIVKRLQSLGVSDTPYEDKNWR